ncbi:MAG: cupin domain-containing protein [Candidatus Moraniibacteriota bacterium]
MHSVHKNIIESAKKNDWFRKEIVTGENSQVFLMSIDAGEDIGEETHSLDQTLVFVSGHGIAMLDGKEVPVESGDLFFVPAGTKHNFINNGSEPLKLFTVYAPNEHVRGTNHETKADALTDPNEH